MPIKERSNYFDRIIDSFGKIIIIRIYYQKKIEQYFLDWFK